MHRLSTAIRTSNPPKSAAALHEKKINTLYYHKSDAPYRASASRRTFRKKNFVTIAP